MEMLGRQARQTFVWSYDAPRAAGGHTINGWEICIDWGFNFIFILASCWGEVIQYLITLPSLEAKQRNAESE